ESGVEAAQLVGLGFTAAARGLEGRRGMAALVSADVDLDAMVASLGHHWELLANTEKPYACGVVSHPTLDAARLLRERIDHPGEIADVEVFVNPVVLDVMAIRSPATGLESKFSVYHCAAVGLLDGRGGPREFSDERVCSPDVVALRGQVRVTTDVAMPRDATRMTVRMRDGHAETVSVDHVEGLDAARLTAKARDLLEPILGANASAAVEQLISLELDAPVASAVAAVTPSG
ncbi:MAG: MmgE/PrpD family protein, partial [Candidatus Dormibacteria bacterium]